MKYFLADIHLHRALLFFREKEYPKASMSPQADLAAAEKLINACGYTAATKTSPTLNAPSSLPLILGPA